MPKLLVTKLLVLLLVLFTAHKLLAAPNPTAKLAAAHFLQHGVRLPSRKFTEAMRQAAMDISHMSCRRSLVILAMANEEAMNHTVPLFLESLHRVVLSAGEQSGQTMDANTVLVAWSWQALAACQALQSIYRHRCVRDGEHRGGTGSFGFHSKGFHALGFAKVKYILNGLSAGHDVVFLDTDIVVLRDPLPYFMSRGGDVYAALEKCLLVKDSYSFDSEEFRALGKKVPPLNIGVLYFKATPLVTRCVYNWIWDMYGEVPWRPKVWDQDIFGKIMLQCTAAHGLRLQLLDPRLFQSACFPACGCAFEDRQARPKRYGEAAEGVPPVNASSRLCAPSVWEHWLVRHFPCSMDTAVKSRYMRNMLDGVLTNQPADITYRWS